jgi:alkyl sulfatase BDS1-like metallo-beta-lactamase superfamily hydrolase
VIAAAPVKFVDYFRVRIDPEKSGTTNKLIRFEFADGSKAGLHVRRAIAEFVPDPDEYQHKTYVTVSMSGETWVKLYLSQATPEDLIKEGEIKVKGNTTEAAQLLDLFDRYKPEKAMAIPPALFGNAG